MVQQARRKHRPKKYRTKDKSFRAQCRALTSKGVACRNSSSIKKDFLCGSHLDSTNNIMSVYDYKKKLSNVAVIALQAKRREQRERVQTGFANMSYEAAQIGRDAAHQNAMQSLPVETQKQLRGLPIVIR